MLSMTASPAALAAPSSAAQAARWQMFESEHFRIFHQPGTTASIGDLGAQLERAYMRVAVDFKHDVAEPIAVILLLRRQDLPGSDDQALTIIAASGAPPTAEHILFSVDDLEADPAVAVHEITHVFLFDIMPVSSRAFRWLSEGLAEYERGTWQHQDLAAVRTAAAAGTIPTLDSLSDGDRAWGHALSDFVARQYGSDGIRQYLAALRLHAGDLAGATSAAFDTTLAALDRRFAEYVTSVYGTR